MTNTKKISTAVIGANGYTGIELVRLLLQHPQAHLTSITSRQYDGEPLSRIFPAFAGLSDLKFEPANLNRIGKACQVVFLCLPHHESMEAAAHLRKMGVKVIDLSADFRFDSIKTYEKFYGPHSQKQLNKQSVYGLCEIFAEDIKRTQLVAVPGCYVTSILLALAPLLQNQMILPKHIICDSKSGTSGAGRGAKVEQLFAEVHDNFYAYGLTNHRHRPEIEEKLTLLAGKPVNITFTPHLLPIARGILSTIYCKPIRKWNNNNLYKTMTRFYKRSPFIHILPPGQAPQIKSVVGTNRVQISAHYDDHSEQIIIVSVLDNLLKGASGQAVQCFNLMHDFEETTGLLDFVHFP